MRPVIQINDEQVPKKADVLFRFHLKRCFKKDLTRGLFWFEIDGV